MPTYLDDTEIGTRVARDSSGKTYKVPADMTYKQWYNKYVANNPEAILAEEKWKNRYIDKEQYKKYKEMLGKDLGIKSLDEFQELKYNKIEKWEDLKGFYKYKTSNPKGTQKHYRIKKEIERLGIKGTIHVPAKDIDIQDVGFDDYHINIVRQHGVTKEKAISYIKESKVSITKWNGQIENYYSNEGATYVDVKEQMIKNSFKKDEFDELTKAMLEVFNNYE